MNDLNDMSKNVEPNDFHEQIVDHKREERSKRLQIQRRIYEIKEQQQLLKDTENYWDF